MHRSFSVSLSRLNLHVINDNNLCCDAACSMIIKLHIYNIYIYDINMTHVVILQHVWSLEQAFHFGSSAYLVFFFLN